MGGKIGNALFFVLLALGLLLFAYRGQISTYFNASQEFTIRNMTFEDMLGYEATIQDGFRGYIVFYTDMKGCTACLSKIVHLKDVAKNFEDIGFYAVVNEKSSRRPFGELMATHEFPGDLMQDPDKHLTRRLGLTSHPMLLFFNRDGLMLAGLPLDVEHEALVRQIYSYIEEM